MSTMQTVLANGLTGAVEPDITLQGGGYVASTDLSVDTRLSRIGLCFVEGERAQAVRFGYNSSAINMLLQRCFGDTDATHRLAIEVELPNLLLAEDIGVQSTYQFNYALPPLVVSQFSWLGQEFLVEPPLMIHVAREEGWYVAQDSLLTIDAIGASTRELLNDIQEQLFVLWKEYGNAANCELTPAALDLAKTVRLRVRLMSNAA